MGRKGNEEVLVRNREETEAALCPGLCWGRDAGNILGALWREMGRAAGGQNPAPPCACLAEESSQPCTQAWLYLCSPQAQPGAPGPTSDQHSDPMLAFCRVIFHFKPLTQPRSQTAADPGLA